MPTLTIQRIEPATAPPQISRSAISTRFFPRAKSSVISIDGTGPVPKQELLKSKSSDRWPSYDPRHGPAAQERLSGEPGLLRSGERQNPVRDLDG